MTAYDFAEGMRRLTEAARTTTHHLQVLVDAIYPHRRVTDRRVRTKLLRRDRRAARRMNRGGLL